MRKAWCLPASSVVQRGGELLRPERDVEAGLLRHLLDHFAHPPLLRVVDDHQLEAVAAGEPGVGQELLGARHVARRALPRLLSANGLIGAIGVQPGVYWPS